MTGSAAVLVVEDDAAIRAMLDRGLRAAGHRPRFAATVEEARLAWTDAQLSVVLLDVMLPDGDGLDLLAERRRAGDRTPVALLTAREDRDLPVRAAAAGAALLAKPFAYAELLACIERLAGLSEDRESDG